MNHGVSVSFRRMLHKWAADGPAPVSHGLRHRSHPPLRARFRRGLSMAKPRGARVPIVPHAATAH
ncbi:hypothetical protein [Azospirillum palustre]